MKNSRYFGRKNLSEKEFSRYYNEHIPERNPSFSLPLEKIRNLGLLLPAGENVYAYWQIFILHDIMQMKAEYVFNFNDEKIFSALLKSDFHAIDRSNLIAGNVPFGGVQGLNKSKQFERHFRAVGDYIESKTQYELPYIQSSKVGWGETIDIPDRVQKLNYFAKMACDKHGIGRDEFLDFIRYQCERWEDVRCSELADEYKKNISYTVAIYKGITEQKYEDVTKNVGRGSRQFFEPHEVNVLDRIFPDWKKVAEYKSRATINGVCEKNLHLTKEETSLLQAAIEDKGLFQLYLAINEILEYQTAFDQEGVSHLQKALRSLAICFEESAAKFSGASLSLKENLRKCWSPNQKGAIFGKGGYYVSFTGSQGEFSKKITDIQDASLDICESGTSEEHAKILLSAVLIRNHVVHENLVDNDNLPITKHAIALIEAIVLTFLKSRQKESNL